MHFNLQEIYENSTDNNMRDESEIPFLTHWNWWRNQGAVLWETSWSRWLQ
jgi:hypothetical protein